MKQYKRAAVAFMTALTLTGCQGEKLTGQIENKSPASGEKKVFRYGTTAYGPEMGNAGLNPHDNYSGWSAVRYGVGESLFRFNENMELEPWLAKGYEQVNSNTVLIHLRDDVFFTSGRKMDGQAVKECLENLIEVHDRAPDDLAISSILAEGQDVTITCQKMTPALLNHLSDPYGAIIDMEYGVTEDRNVAGTGPYIAYEVADDHVYLEKNNKYWGGEVNVDRVEVIAITDGDTLTMALQSGQIDASQGLPYASIPLFQDNERYTISSADTSRVFFAAMNFRKPMMQDENVRKAIAMGIDKEGFAAILLNGNGSPAAGPFPANYTFGNQAVTALSYDPDGARQLLEESGWTDTDGDGYVDKDGQMLSIRWLTYPGRQELPLLAELAQAELRDIGIHVQINSTTSYLEIIPTGQWDIYASAFVTAPTGDPAYFFTTHCLERSARNRGEYQNGELEELAKELETEFDTDRRSDIAVRMEQLILDDNAFLFVAHLRMSFVMKQSVTGFTAHPSDYYELTSELDIGGA